MKHYGSASQNYSSETDEKSSTKRGADFLNQSSDNSAFNRICLHLSKNPFGLMFGCFWSALFPKLKFLGECFRETVFLERSFIFADFKRQNNTYSFVSNVNSYSERPDGRPFGEMQSKNLVHFLTSKTIDFTTVFCCKKICLKSNQSQIS